jgi:hypothetical protein
MKADLKAVCFYTPDEVASLFRHEGDKRFAYRAARPGGFLHPYARRFGRSLLFTREGVDSLTQKDG